MFTHFYCLLTVKCKSVVQYQKINHSTGHCYLFLEMLKIVWNIHVWQYSKGVSYWLCTFCTDCVQLLIHYHDSVDSSSILKINKYSYYYDSSITEKQYGKIMSTGKKLWTFLISTDVLKPCLFLCLIYLLAIDHTRFSITRFFYHRIKITCICYMCDIVTLNIEVFCEYHLK